MKSDKPRKLAERRSNLRLFRSQQAQNSLKTKVDAFLRHPVTLLIMGFFLTAVLGSAIQRQQLEADKERAELIEAGAALSRLNKVMLEYRVKINFAVRTPNLENNKQVDEAFLRLASALTVELQPVLAPFGRDDYEGDKSALGTISATPAQRAFTKAILGFASMMPPEDEIFRYLSSVIERKNIYEGYAIVNQVTTAERCLASISAPIYASLEQPSDIREAAFISASNQVMAAWKKQADAGDVVAQDFIRICPLVDPQKTISDLYEILPK